tara:strand:+ start:273 stop:1142 length:870 start_codon:yes stop_codon:yes gene_type:complete
MKRLNPPATDDFDVLRKLCNNTKLKCNPAILDEYLVMKKQYVSYEGIKGNPWLYNTSGINGGLAEALKYHYERPSKDLAFIKILRNTGSADVCPMCGSLKTADLDHFLPQADYPELAIFSKNLVPACDCNRTRRNDVKGATSSERVLHPYYDDFLHHRLISCSITGNLEEPRIRIEVLRIQNVPFITVDFHVKTVLERSTIISWLSAKWCNINRKPSSVIHGIPKTSFINSAKLKGILDTLLENKDDEHQTPNNWYSILFHGILSDQNLLNWIVNRHNFLVRGPNLNSF